MNEREFYTPYGWKGEKYGSTQNLPRKEVAKRIKKEIEAKFPKLGVSVRSEFFSNGSAINIKVVSVPAGFRIMRKEVNAYGNASYPYMDAAKALLEALQRIANQYRYDDSDGQIDYFNTNFYCTPEFAWELRSKEEKELGVE